MKITQVKLRKIIDNNTNLKGIVSVTIDDALAIHDIKIVKGLERTFVAMPVTKYTDCKYRDTIHPINQEFRSYLESQILHQYEQVTSHLKRNNILLAL